MPPQLALILCLAFIVVSHRVTVKRKPNVSPAIWLVEIWIIIIASRPLSLWLNPNLRTVDTTDGSPLERTIYSILIGIAFVILIKRKFDWARFIQQNPLIFLMLLYMGCSVLWSDFPWTAFKRYIKLLGMVGMALLILTERDVTATVKTLIRRSSYVLIPVSIMLIKYYPDLGVRYWPWTGERMITGVAFNKNGLGQICLVLGFVMLWVVLGEMKNRGFLQYRLQFLIDLFLLTLVIDTLLVSDSKTSLVCLVVGISVLVSLRFSFIRRRIGALLVIAALSYAFLEWSMDISTVAAVALGRDPTLTNRTEIWQELLALRDNFWVGTGFDSFWLGDRLLFILETRNINEAHNGFLEIFLNFGFIGLLLFSTVIMAAYGNCKKLLSVKSPHATLVMALLVLVMMYSLAESGFRGLSLINLCFYLVSINAAEVCRPVTRPAFEKNLSHLFLSESEKCC